MPRLLPYVRPRRYTVPNIYAFVADATTPIGSYNLPTTGSLEFDYTYPLNFTLRRGYILALGVTFTRTGSWLGKRWTGDYVVRRMDLVCPDVRHPECFTLSGGIEFRDGGPLSQIFGNRTYGVGETAIPLRFTFNVGSYSGSPPFTISITLTRSIWRPDSFVDWQP